MRSAVRRSEDQVLSFVAGSLTKSLAMRNPVNNKEIATTCEVRELMRCESHECVVERQVPLEISEWA